MRQISKSWVHRAASLLLVFLLAASCGPRDPVNHRLASVVRGDEPVASTRLDWRRGQADHKADLVTLALSGGGVKSSTFSAESMFYLQAIGLLQKVNVVSSVSGGSYAAARYVLSCDPGLPDCQTAGGGRRPVWDYATTMRSMTNSLTDLKTIAILGIFFPYIPGLSTSVPIDRYADIIDRNYLRTSETQGPPFTFADLRAFRTADIGAGREPRPDLVLNATIVSDSRYGVGLRPATHYLRRRNADEYFHFAFTDFYFGTIGSDLSRMPLSTGVAASAAIPVVIDYLRLTDYRTCRLSQVNDDKVCDAGRRNRMALTDGGANDNQGLSEIYAILGEHLLGEARSDHSANPPGPAPRSRDAQWMTKGDRALQITVNSAITEATGVQAINDYAPWIIGNFNRATGAVDIYAGTEVNLRRRLYRQNRDEANRMMAAKWGYGPISDVEIALVTLDRYRDGGPQASSIRLSRICVPALDRDCPPDFDRGASELAAAAIPRRAAWDRLMRPDARSALKLGRTHPQCLFEVAKYSDGLVNGLMSLQPHAAICLRHAARWSAALAGQELCERKGANFPINDRTALNCGPDGTLTLRHPDIIPSPDTRDGLESCDLTQYTRQQNEGILYNLAANGTFRTENSARSGRVSRLWDNQARMTDDSFRQEIAAICTLDAPPP